MCVKIAVPFAKSEYTPQHHNGSMGNGPCRSIALHLLKWSDIYYLDKVDIINQSLKHYYNLLPVQIYVA